MLLGRSHLAPAVGMRDIPDRGQFVNRERDVPASILWDREASWGPAVSAGVVDERHPVDVLAELTGSSKSTVVTEPVHRTDHRDPVRLLAEVGARVPHLRRHRVPGYPIRISACASLAPEPPAGVSV